MLKIIAMVTMLIDHIGFGFFPDYPAIRCVGRISMPIFAYLIAQGMSFTTKHHTEKQYAIRLLCLGFISWLPFYAFFSPDGLVLNICFSWFVAVLTIWGAHKLPKEYALLSLPFVVILLSQSAFEYQFLAAGFAVTFWLFLIRKDLPIYRYGAAIVLISIYTIIHPSYIHVFHLLGFAVVDLVRPIEKKHKTLRKKIPKELSYSFYPVHLLILTAIRAVLSL